MTLRDRVIAWAAVGLLVIGPAHAQQAQGTDVTGTSSDVSGTLTQSDAYLFQTDESRIRMNDVAASLSDALRSGRLDESVAGSRPMTVSAPTAALILSGSKAEKTAAAQQFAEVLTERGLAPADARLLAEKVAGLLDEGTVTPDAFLAAVEAFNAAVDVAPPGFLTQPPQEFIVVRAVLMALLEGATI
jgi:hypothetical protein